MEIEYVEKGDTDEEMEDVKKPTENKTAEPIKTPI